MAAGAVKWFNDAGASASSRRTMVAKRSCDALLHPISMSGFKFTGEGKKVQFDVTQGPKTSRRRTSSIPDRYD